MTFLTKLFSIDRFPVAVRAEHERQFAGRDAAADVDPSEALSESNVNLKTEAKGRSEVNKKVTEEEDKLKNSRMALLRRLLAINMPELPWILIGMVAAILFGAATPMVNSIKSLSGI